MHVLGITLESPIQSILVMLMMNSKTVGITSNVCSYLWFHVYSLTIMNLICFLESERKEKIILPSLRQIGLKFETFRLRLKFISKGKGFQKTLNHIFYNIWLQIIYNIIHDSTAEHAFL